MKKATKILLLVFGILSIVFVIFSMIMAITGISLAALKDQDLVKAMLDMGIQIPAGQTAEQFALVMRASCITIFVIFTITSLAGIVSIVLDFVLLARLKKGGEKSTFKVPAILLIVFSSLGMLIENIIPAIFLLAMKKEQFDSKVK